MTDSFRTTVRSVRYHDSLNNFEARIGVGTDNQLSSSTYGFNPLSRNRQQLDNMYRSSWVVRQVVGVIPEDMTRAGIELKGMRDPEDAAKLQKAFKRKAVWKNLTSGAKWGRLYGGALGVIMIDGQRTNTPLRVNTITLNQFQGIMILDRWQLTPSSELVTVPGPDFGKPVSYQINTRDNATAPQRDDIHHTRVIRFEGDDLPHFQRQYEMGWGMSVVEPFYDRLVAFDSTTMGMAQMVFKAHLRTLKMKDLRRNIAAGGKVFEAAISQVNLMRRYQSMEGMTLIDGDDDFQSATYNFAGLSDVLIQMSQQVSGATKIPIVKLFGMSPAGFSSGDTDLRSYYDNVGLIQESDLRRPLGVLLEVAHWSEFGRPPEKDFDFDFLPLWGMSSQEKAEVAGSTVTAVTGAQSSGLLKISQGMRELKMSSEITGIFSSITDEDVEAQELAEQATPDDEAPPGEDLDPSQLDDSSVSDPNIAPEQDNEETGSQPSKLGAATAQAIAPPKPPKMIGL